MAVVGQAQERMGSPGPLSQTKDGFTITRTFQVKTSSHADGALTVDQAVGLPQIGQSYQTPNESHAYLVCTDRRIRRLSDKSLWWVVECEYRTPQYGQKEDQAPNTGPPEFDLPVIRVGSTSELRDVVKDRDGNPIVNSANDPFKPHPKREVFFPTLTIQRNEPINSPLGQTQLAYIGKVNSDEFWGLQPGQWRIVNITGDIASRTLSNGSQVPYVAVTYEFHARDSWALEILDAGWNYKDGSNKVAFRTKTGTEYEGFLDGSTGAESATPHYLEFDIYEEIEFAGLNLPQSLLEAVL